MKKFISVLLAVVMTVSVISCLALTSYAASPVVITVSSKVDSSASDTIVVTADLSEDSNLSGLQFVLKYDTSSLEYVSGSATCGGLWGYEELNDSHSGRIKIATVQTKGITKGGTMLSAKFKVLDSSSAAVSAEVPEAIDGSDNDVTSSITVVNAMLGQVAMYRMYNPNSGEHFYTASEAERNSLRSIGWTYEGVGWKAPSSSTTPVYRLYNQNGGEHHYTINAAEKDNLVALGWSYEGIGWYSDDNHSVPIYRQYNPNEFANNHNYTASKGENDYLVSLGWYAEGIGWYGVA